jgi:ribosome-binding factor A
MAMRYAIFEIEKDLIGRIDRVIRDDVVSRQSIVTRDANSLDIGKEVVYVKIEGSEEGLKRAEELFKEMGIKRLSKKKAEGINEKMESQDEDAAIGMGMIFG